MMVLGGRGSDKLNADFEAINFQNPPLTSFSSDTLFTFSKLTT